MTERERKRLEPMVPELCETMLSLDKYPYCDNCEWYGTGAKDICEGCLHRKLFSKVYSVINEMRRRLYERKD